VPLSTLLLTVSGICHSTGFWPDSEGRRLRSSIATGFSTKFPGIKPHLLTLSRPISVISKCLSSDPLIRILLASNFKIPFYRDILLALGICSVSKKSCSNVLRKGPGQSITIVVGGAAESLAAHPGTNDLTLKKRLGFIKLAVREG